MLFLFNNNILNAVFQDKVYQFKKLRTYDWKNGGSAEARDFTLNIDYKEKSLGKERGDTRKKVYDALK